MRRLLSLIAFLGVVLAALWAAPAIAQRNPGGAFLRISFVDVGQGDAIWIQAPDQDNGSPGGNMIIDGGPDTGEKNQLIKYLKAPRYGLEPGSAIDCIVASHPHDDHYPGLMDVLEQYEVRTIIDSGYPKERRTASGRPSKFEMFRQAAIREQVGGRRSRFVELRNEPGFVLECGNIEARIIYADSANARDMGSRTNTRENNASTVIKLTFGAFSFLFMGDAEGKERADSPDSARYVERTLLDRAQREPNLLPANVLKVAHHGSETGSTVPFIRAVDPDVVVIMSGRRQFGTRFLPDQSVIDRYRRENSALVVLRTDENDEREGRDTTNDADGDDVYMYTDGETLRVYRAVTGSDSRRRWRLVKTLRGETEP